MIYRVGDVYMPYLPKAMVEQIAALSDMDKNILQLIIFLLLVWGWLEVCNRDEFK